MNIKRLILIFLLIFNNFALSSLFSYTNIKPHFLKGETLVYDIKVLDLKVGEQRSILKDIIKIHGKTVYYYYTTIKTTPLISKFYRLSNTIQTYIDTQTYLPVLIKTIILQKKHHNEIEIRIDQKRKQAIYKDKFGEQKITFKKNFFGLISIMIYLRTIIPAENEVIEFSVHNHRKQQIIQIKTEYPKKEIFIAALNKKCKILNFQDINDPKGYMYMLKGENPLPCKFNSIKIPIVNYGYIYFLNELSEYKRGQSP